MNNIPLIIMAAGVSSRMKESRYNLKLTNSQIEQSKIRTKSFIELGHDKETLIFYLFKNALEADVKNFYIIIAKDSKEFQNYLLGISKRLNVNVNIVIQDYYGREKPLGTADAILQAMNQYVELKESRFLVCNSDNLYSSEVFRILIQDSKNNSMIGYDSKCLNFSNERISTFAILKTDKDYLSEIKEKPNISLFENEEDKILISMNIFSFIGNKVYNYFHKCPIHKQRGEKEIATVIQKMISDNKKSIKVYSRCEHVPDLTFKDDIHLIQKYLKEN